MFQSIKAGAIYFALVFAFGFVFGTFRTPFLVPAFGEIWATLCELPFILAVSWWACRLVLRRFTVSSPVLMGVTAFALLLAGEAMISILLGGLTLREHITLYRNPAPQLGLLAQIAFAAFPRLSRHSSIGTMK